MANIEIFRGQVYQDKKFHLYFKDVNNVRSTDERIYILCMCVNSSNETILYWSCDPSDFTPSTYASNRNYGPAVLTYEYDSAVNTFLLYYENIYKVKTPINNNQDLNNFSIYANGGNSSANIIYYSHPSGYTITKNGGIQWTFRKDASSGSRGKLTIYTHQI